MLEDASRSLLAFDGSGWVDVALSGCKEREHCTVASVVGETAIEQEVGHGLWG